MPFANEFERDIHFSKHGHKVGATSAVEYERMADEFMFSTMTLSTRECVRPNGAHRLRFNLANRYFGAANITPEFVKTFYPIAVHTLARHGGGAAYFGYECGRINL
jgi:hypothetical protein